MKNIKTILSIICGAIVIAMPLNAGVLMVSNQKSSTQNEEAITLKAYLDKNCMKIDTKGKDANQSFIFRVDKEVFWIIDNKEKEYMEMTKKDLQAMKGQMDEAMKMMEEQMNNLPPEQKKMMEDMMKSKMPVKAPEIVYKKVGSKEKVNQWVCDKYEGYLDGKKKEEIWTTDWQKFGLHSDDFKIMETMGEFLGESFKELASFYKVNSDKKGGSQGISGLPIKTISYLEGKEYIATELKEIQRQSFTSSIFDLPTGFKKVKMVEGIEEIKEMEEED